MIKIAQNLKSFLFRFDENNKFLYNCSLNSIKDLNFTSSIKSFYHKKINNFDVNHNFENVKNYGLFFNSKYIFSKAKKPLQKLFLSKKLINNQENGYVIYNSTLDKSFKIVSLILLFAIAISYGVIYFTEPQDRTDQYVILGLLALSFMLYQRRILRTLKKVVIEPKGLELHIDTHSFMGIESQHQTIRWLNPKVMIVPIELMNGIGKGTVIGGNVINAGGKYDFKQIKFWFSRKYILDRIVFQQVVNGKHVIFKDQYKMI